MKITIKKAEEILDNGLSLLKPNSFIQIFYKINREKVLNIIRQIQEEAIRETVKECLNNLEPVDRCSNGTPIYSTYEQSLIFSTADKLIKEL